MKRTHLSSVVFDFGDGIGGCAVRRAHWSELGMPLSHASSCEIGAGGGTGTETVDYVQLRIKLEYGLINASGSQLLNSAAAAAW